jgi:hypothetical protein
MITTADALRSLKPGAEWSLRDDDELEWLDSEQTEPTQAEIDTEIARLDAEYVANEYQRDRASAYPTWQDQLDDIFHNGIDGWKATIQVTKDKYPKG